MAIRNGRFRVTASGGDLNHVIVSLGDKGKGGAFYRILNSGDDSFVVKYKNHSNGDETHTVLKEQSFDLYVKEEGTLTIFVADGTTAEGIYDFLGDGTARALEDVRSGRFKLSDGSVMTQVADFSGDNKATAFYRFFNSGANAFKILSNGVELVADLQPSNSADVSATLNENLQVQQVAASGTEALEGIYDFLAGDDG